ncbi:LOW QUALITY PROTEIN: hypothetical protein HID58_028227 [Brassica napus]|uniref:F-box domain-containing protein n=1 Tax=Brassica napus TaxID=3708 RepID=A0ABQ8C9P5_BRANA|nr:LOW QUALITY PROTEIN: hypothetical protein HID58_028227 [Brassica napus]
MAPRKVETGGRDLISSLPDELLSEILYLLPTQTAASTSILSKRWKNLLPLVHNLDFDKSTMVFASLISRTLVLLGDSPIHKFSLEWKSEKAQHLIYPLIYNALQREVLELHLISPKRQFVPSELFFSKTLVKLTLTLGCFARRNDNSCLLRLLKCMVSSSLALCLRKFTFAMMDLIARFGSTGLGFIHQEDNHFLPPPVLCSLTTLVMSHKIILFSLMILLSKLDWIFGCGSIMIMSYHYLSHMVINFQSMVNIGGDATKLILGVSNVVTLHLSPGTWLASIATFAPEISKPGDSYHQWSCTQDYKFMWRCMCLRSWENDEELLLIVLSGEGVEGSCGELNQMRHFLKNLRFLKLVKVKVQEQVNYLSLTNDLTKLLSTASSSNCKIQFI